MGLLDKKWYESLFIVQIALIKNHQLSAYVLFKSITSLDLSKQVTSLQSLCSCWLGGEQSMALSMVKKRKQLNIDCAHYRYFYL